MNSVTVKKLGITFTVGQEYNHPKWGNYTVKSINDSSINVTFKDGSNKELTTLIAATMIFNQQCEEEKVVGKTGSTEDIMYTIGRIAKLGKIFVCGIRDNEYDSFKQRYEKAGNKIDKIENISLLTSKANKWGVELSIKLPENFNNENIVLPEKVKILESNIINNNKFVWSLIEKTGFVLGDKQDYNRILSKLKSETMKNAFIKGYQSI